MFCWDKKYIFNSSTNSPIYLHDYATSTKPISTISILGATYIWTFLWGVANPLKISVGHSLTTPAKMIDNFFNIIQLSFSLKFFQFIFYITENWNFKLTRFWIVQHWKVTVTLKKYLIMYKNNTLYFLVKF